MVSDEKISGGCMCGAVRYEAVGILCLSATVIVIAVDDTPVLQLSPWQFSRPTRFVSVRATEVFTIPRRVWDVAFVINAEPR